MVSKSQIKLITSLAQKKYRTKHGLFLVEGRKGITELLQSGFELDSLFTTEAIFDAPGEKTFEITNAGLRKISQLRTPQTAVAVFKIPPSKSPQIKDLSIALDGIRDPGNLGTIIRLCDWFGIEELICSRDTVDCYNPKVVQATMGSISRVNVSYLDIGNLLQDLRDIPVYGAFLEGSNVYETQLPHKGVLVLGNEANGISAEIERHITSKIHIPQYGSALETESLNVATAASILISEFRRNGFTGK